MAGITQADKKVLIQLAISMLGIAPGQTYLKLMVDTMVSNELSLSQAAAELAKLPQFSVRFPGFLIPQEVAQRLAHDLLAPYATAEQIASAAGLALNLLYTGLSPAEVILKAIQALNANTSPIWASAQAAWNNKVEVASYHAEILGRTETDLAILAQVLDGVTDNPATVEAAKLRLNPPPPPVDSPAPPPPPPPPPDFTLTAGADTPAAGAGNDTIDAPVGTLNSPDVIDGLGGNDKLTVTVGAGASSPTITSVERINFTVNGGYSLGASNVTGPTELHIQGASTFTLTGNIGTGGSWVVDGSALTGNLVISGNPVTAITIKGGSAGDSIKGGSGNDTLSGGGGNDTLIGGGGVDSVTGGGGDDLVTMESAVLAGHSLDGGTGTDTLELLVSQGAVAASVSNFEVLRVNSTNAAITVDTSFMSLAGVTIEVAGTNDVTLNQLTNNATVKLLENTPLLTQTLAVPGGGADTLTLKLAQAASPATLANVTGLETLQLVLDGAAGTTNTITTNSVTAAQVLTGAANLTVTNALQTTSFDASAFTGDLNVRVQLANPSSSLKGGSGNDTLQGGQAADTLIGGAGNDTIQLGAVSFLANGTGADTVTTGTGSDVVRFVGTVAAGTGAAANYSTFAHVTDFAVASDQLAFSANDVSFSLGAVNGLSKGATAQGLAATDAMVVQAVAQNGSATALGNVSFIKLTTAVAFTTDVKGTFAAALGTATIDSLAANGNYLVSAYDTTNARMVLAVVNVGSNAGGDTNLAGNDLVDAGISIVGVLSMSAGDYAAFGAGQLAAAF